MYKQTPKDIIELGNVYGLHTEFQNDWQVNFRSDDDVLIVVYWNKKSFNFYPYRFTVMMKMPTNKFRYNVTLLELETIYNTQQLWPKKTTGNT